MGNKIREIDYAEMEKSSDEKAKERFKKIAYPETVISSAARKLIRAQGNQMIRKGVDEGGQRNPD
jgi:hypothetical protein